MPFGKGGKNRPTLKRPASGYNKIERKQKRSILKKKEVLAIEELAKAETEADALATANAGALATAEAGALATAEAHDLASDNAEADKVQSAAKNRVKMTMKEREESGLVVLSQEEMCIYIKVAYAIRYDEPMASEWGPVAGELMRETCMRRDTILEIFSKCHSGVPHPEQQKQGCGRPVKLGPENKGLIAAAVAINIGVSPAHATEICNMHNAMESPSITVCRNTLMSTIQQYTNVDISAVEHRKPGS